MAHADHDFHAEFSRVYRRWHALEQATGSGALVLDFDMAAPVGDPGVAGSRAEVRAALHGLLDAAATEPLVNRAFVVAKLGGAIAYLDGLEGEQLPFDDYLRRTMGIAPAPPSRTQLAEQRRALAAAFEARGIRFAREGRAAFGARYGHLSPQQLAVDLRHLATECVRRVLRLLPGVPEPHYTIEVVEQDAYWSNWIDGSADRGVVLRINTHERVQYNSQSALPLAAHEIAGHAVHVGALRQAATRGALDPCALNLAVHSCEAFQMEGLAQLALRVLFDDGELHPDLLLLEQHRDYTGARINLAQVEMERGKPLDQAVAEVLHDCPLLKALSVRSSLRDRASDPLYRSYIHVYAPARRLFQRAAALPREARDAFFLDAWTGLFTPAQLRARLA